LGGKIYREKICGLLKFLPRGISIHPAVLPKFTPRLKTNNKQSSIAQEKAHLTIPLPCTLQSLLDNSDCSVPIPYFSGLSKINGSRLGLLLYYVDST